VASRRNGQSVLKPGLLEKAAEAGMRSLFVGLETLSPVNLREQNKGHNVGRDYNTAIQRCMTRRHDQRQLCVRYG
jgi:hypothetical protein